MSLINYIQTQLKETNNTLDIDFINTFSSISHTTNEFPIDIELLVTWKVDSRKDNAKARLKKIFIENQDYKTASESLEAVFSNGGQNKETILLTVDCFKGMCMLANNEKGKLIRGYYIILEKIVKKFLETEYNNKQRKLEEESNKKLDEINMKYETLSNRIHKKKINIEQKECIYIFGYKELPNYCKIGKTVNIKQRISSTTDIPFDIVLFYTKETSHKDIIEKMVFYNLSSLRVKNYKEWFYCEDIDILKKEIDSCVEFLNKRHKTKYTFDDKYISESSFTSYMNNNKEEFIIIEEDIELNPEDKSNDNCEFIITRGDKQGSNCTRKKYHNENYCNRHLRCIDPSKKIKPKNKVTCTQKYCPKCEKTLDVFPYFNLNSARTDGLDSYCKKCKSEQQNQRYLDKKELNKKWLCECCRVEKILKDFYNTDFEKCIECVRKDYLKGDTTCIKQCTKCDIIKLLENFNMNDNSKDHYNSICNDCIKIITTEECVDQLKTCRLCDKQLCFDKFYKDKTKDGYMTKCKACWKKRYY